MTSCANIHFFYVSEFAFFCISLYVEVIVEKIDNDMSNALQSLPLPFVCISMMSELEPTWLPQETPKVLKSDFKPFSFEDFYSKKRRLQLLSPTNWIVAWK